MRVGCAPGEREKNESETGAESKSRSHSYVFKLETKMASGNPLITLERMLNGRTTLKTQKVTHTNIVCKYRYFLFCMSMKFPTSLVILF